MKLYLLRHEERPLDQVGFETELTNMGKSRASTSLKNKLKAINIDEIFCSPFIRTLQTIDYYMKDESKVANIEFAISEGLKEEETSIDLSKIERFNINLNYESSIDNVSYPENINDTIERVDIFINNLLKSNKNILLCTHQTIVHIIISKLCNIDMSVLNFKMGMLGEIDESMKLSIL